MPRTAMLAGLAVLIATILALSPSAQAACPIGDTTCDPGGGTTTTHPLVHLNVSTPSQGTVTDDAGKISCGAAGSDCSETYSSTRTCSGADSCTTTGPSVTLTASGGGSGYGPHWSGCDSASGSTCSLTMDGDRDVTLTWTDDANPTAGLSSPPAKAGPSTTFNATASDNSGFVSKVDFYVDGVLRATDTSAPFQYQPDLSPYADGSSHALKVISQDGAGRVSSDLASAPSATFSVDKSTGATGVSTPPAFTQSAPDVSFGVPADATSVVCRTKLGGTQVGSTPGCTSPYSPQGITTDGEYSVEIAVTDDVGNSATVTKTFTLDRGAPNLTVGAPANGAVIGGPFTPAASATDGFSGVTFGCKIDSGAFGSCASLAPSDGAHTVTVRAGDAAGNTSEEQRSFTYDSHAPVVGITGGPGEGTVVYARSTAFTFTTTDLTAVTRSCRLDGGAFGPCTSATGHSLGGLSLGIHTFTLRVVDAAGHATTAQRRFTVADRPTDTGGTTQSAGTTGGTGGTGGTVGTTGPTVRTATVTTFWLLFGKRTQVGTLTLEGAPKGAKVKVTCKGKGCAFKNKTVTATGAKIMLAKRFKTRKLAARTVITITVSDATGSKRFRYTLRAAKFPKRSIA